MPGLKIDDRQPISYFQKEFSTLFPFLKIAFYKASVKQENGKDHKTSVQLPSSYRLGNDTVSIMIDNSTTVGQLKSMILEETGVVCVVYRKSGSMWIETSLTEDWSLERQNHEAELMNNS